MCPILVNKELISGLLIDHKRKAKQVLTMLDVSASDAQRGYSRSPPHPVEFPPRAVWILPPVVPEHRSFRPCIWSKGTFQTLLTTLSFPTIL